MSAHDNCRSHAIAGQWPLTLITLMEWYVGHFSLSTHHTTYDECEVANIGRGNAFAINIKRIQNAYSSNSIFRARYLSTKFCQETQRSQRTPAGKSDDNATQRQYGIHRIKRGKSIWKKREEDEQSVERIWTWKTIRNGKP